MKFRILCIILLFCNSNSNAQNLAEQFLGSWDGFGFAQNFGVKEVCLTRLSIEKDLKTRDMVKCTFITIPISDNQNFGRDVRSIVFNAYIKNGYLENKIDDENLEKLFLVLDNNEFKIYYEHYESGMSWEYLHTKSTNVNLDVSTTQKITNCEEITWKTKFPEVLRDKSLNINSFPLHLQEEIRKEIRMQVDVGCITKSLDLSTAKYSYIKELKLLAINIAGMTPFYFTIDEIKAREIISSKKVNFNFKKLEMYSEDNINVIIPIEVEGALSGISKPLVFPQKELAEAGNDKIYSGYIQKKAKILSK